MREWRGEAERIEKEERSREDVGGTRGRRGRGDKSPAGELIGSRWRYLFAKACGCEGGRDSSVCTRAESDDGLWTDSPVLWRI